MAGDVSSSGEAAGPADPARPRVPDAPLALYRRYRPATFAEVKGQEHVTEPLRQALRTGRVNHAYLFSGPRGCGKTSSARILARSLNCEAGPTPDPCGECASCVALAPAGPGSIDVIEIDAASHGGIDDARDLRERAFYSPVSARYKIYIIDEAHMVTGAGFNALLKLVEEPPPHLKFVFATTEPEKVIATIRSRTHHYPFRLVPPAVLRQLLEQILSAEGISYEPTVLPVVIRAGTGSVRDSLSILDQLMAGSDESGLRYDRAIALLGYTDDALLDEMAEAFAGSDGAAIFGTIDRVVEAGHDPRRFAADLLDRLRDLIVLAAVPDAAASGLLDAPQDRLERMRKQAAGFGQERLVRAAETVSAGLVEMRGATSPRLLLELMCAQVLLPAGPAADSDLAARVERLERRASAAAVADRGPAAAPVGVAGSGVPGPGSPRSAGPRPSAPAPASQQPSPADSGPARTAAQPDRVDSPTTGSGSQVPDVLDTESLRRRWPDVLESVRERRKVAWILLSNANVESVAGNVLTLSFDGEGYAKGFVTSGYDHTLAEVLQSMFGTALTVRIAAQPAAAPGGAGGTQASSADASWADGAASGGESGAGGGASPATGVTGATGSAPVGSPGSSPVGGAGRAPGGTAPGARSGSATPAPDRPSAAGQSAAGNSRPSPQAGPGGPRSATDAAGAGPGTGAALTGTDLIEQALGGRVIEEIGEP
jgi:DNA polymerase III subunit gamma/tau